MNPEGKRGGGIDFSRSTNSPVAIKLTVDGEWDPYLPTFRGTGPDDRVSVERTQRIPSLSGVTVQTSYMLLLVCAVLFERLTPICLFAPVFKAREVEKPIRLFRFNRRWEIVISIALIREDRSRWFRSFDDCTRRKMRRLKRRSVQSGGS